MSRNPKPGDHYLIDACTTTDWATISDVEVTAEKTERLGCGCWRITTERPGPPNGQLPDRMEFTVRRCRFHAANPGTESDAEPQWLHEHDWRPMVDGRDDGPWGCDCGETRTGLPAQPETGE